MTTVLSDVEKDASLNEPEAVDQNQQNVELKDAKLAGKRMSRLNSDEILNLNFNSEGNRQQLQNKDTIKKSIKTLILENTLPQVQEKSSSFDSSEGSDSSLTSEAPSRKSKKTVKSTEEEALDRQETDDEAPDKEEEVLNDFKK